MISRIINFRLESNCTLRSYGLPYSQRSQRRQPCFPYIPLPLNVEIYTDQSASSVDGFNIPVSTEALIAHGNSI